MPLSEFSAWAQTRLSAEILATLASPGQIVAAIAAAAGIALVVAGAFARTMLPLRWLTAASNAALVVYGALHPAPITLLISVTLLPINLYRAIEITRLTRRVRQAQADADLSGLWLRRYMKPRRLRAGQTLFRKGERANRLYMLVEGEMVLADIGKPLVAGRIFGEIALFTPSGLRTHTVQCVSACTVLEIHRRTVEQLYFQNPAFGFHLMKILADRLSADLERGAPATLVDAPAAGQGASSVGRALNTSRP
ncbi:MAG: cyclic nucleotide-binding domain-containing protein [Burkholderiales bacterium]|nr:cyclic nucleotide-binding domain-containing protein [Burkholderiales bacterium]